MISKITGELVGLSEDTATLAIEAFEYQVRVPEFTRLQLQGSLGESISLHTIHYIEGNTNSSRMTPRLIGFHSQIEREFFELFCSVDGVGVKTALRAMVRPVAEVAATIEEQDAKGLATLPGIGPASAERIIAKLRRKMPKFALLVSEGKGQREEASRDVVQETFEMLRTLGHSDTDARRLIDNALETKKKFKDSEALLQAVYQTSHGKG